VRKTKTGTLGINQEGAVAGEPGGQRIFQTLSSEITLGEIDLHKLVAIDCRHQIFFK
jgi:hypothetical protein